MNKRTTVFIVDDSAVVRQVVTAMLSEDPSIEVLGSASDPLFAQQKMAAQWPDVILLDIEMPRMDGISFLKKLMIERPTPVVICSTLTGKGTEMSVEALAAGAVEVITKPRVGLKDFLHEASSDLLRAVKNASRARVKATSKAAKPIGPSATTDTLGTTTDRVIAMGASTGGTQALQSVLTRLPEDCAGIVVVQHMPEKFTAAFSERLNRLCRCQVKEAENGDRVLTGRVLIAHGDRHMQLKRNGAQYAVSIQSGPPVNRHRPSVDVLFRSVAKAAGRNALGVIMTGMGDDGAHGLLAMRRAGAYTLAQDQESCVVYGMPKEARAIGGVCAEVPLLDMADMFAQWSRK